MPEERLRHDSPRMQRPSGRVLVTNIDPRFLEPLHLPNLEVRRHDIATDPLPEAVFDLVHSRLVLLHVPEREEAPYAMIFIPRAC